MENTLPVLIIGQGIAGTLLSFELFQKGIPFLVFDEIDHRCASWVSGAALNPYSGRTISGTNRRMELYKVAQETYKAMENLLQICVLKPSPLIVFESEAATENLGLELKDKFKNTEKIEVFEQVEVVDNILLLQQWRSFLLEKKLLREEKFEEKALILIENALSYKNENFSKIIFCTGVAAMENPLFHGLRFTRNRGDVLLLKIPELSQAYIYQKDKVRLLPKGNETFWCGSNYIWEYENMIPNEVFFHQTISQLEQWLNVPFELMEHQCAKRPTTAGQIPFIGWHPKHSQLGICNGLGTKGYSAGPLWIKNFVEQSLVLKGESLFQSTLDKYL